MTRGLPDGWRHANIRRYASMKTGHTPSRSNLEYWENTTIPWFTLADVWQLRDGRRTYLGETANCISELGLKNSAAELLPAGTVVLSRTASVGFSGIMPCPMATSQDFWNWVCGPDLLPEYLNYQFRSMTPELRGLNMGSTHQTIYKADAAGIEVVVPPLDEQRAIVDFLDRATARIDTLIEEQQRLIDLLRERRQAVVDESFGEAAAASTRFIRLLQQRPTYGVLVPQYVDEHFEGAVPYFRVGDFSAGRLGEAERWISQGQSEEYARTVLAAGDVLLGVVGRMGSAAVVPDWAAGSNVARAVAVLRPRVGIDPHLLAAWFTSSQFTIQAAHATAGDTVQPTLGMGDLAGFEIRWPVVSTPARVHEQTSKIDTLIVETERFIDLACERRSALITTAVAGQIDVCGEVA